MKSDRLDAMNDVLTLPAIKFGLHYKDVVINDGNIVALRKRDRESYIFSNCGRRYCRYFGKKNDGGQ